MALSQQLRRYCISLKDIDPQDGSMDVEFNGQVLAYSKVKKGIYRYDTSLLRRDKWPETIHLTPASKLQRMLCEIITRCVIKDEDNLLSMRMPRGLIALILMIFNNEGTSDQLVNHSTWGLKKRSGGALITLPAAKEQSPFVSCIQSISHECTDTTFPEDTNSDEVGCRWATYLKDEVFSHVQLHKIWCRTLPVAPESLKMMGYFAVTEILMVTLFYCIVLAPDLTLHTLTLSEVVDFSNLPLSGPNILCSELLEILLFTAASQGETEFCEQSMATYVNLDAIRPCSLSVLPEYVNSTALQISLAIDDDSDPEANHEVIMVLLKAGADPNLCGNHGRAQPCDPVCCEQLPFYLALRHSSTILRALLDTGACVPKNLDLTITFHRIADPEVLSVLLEKGVSPEGASCFNTQSWYFCPLQAALDHQNRQAALKLLERVENSLGCSVGNSQEIQDVCNADSLCNQARVDRDFRTPFTHAVLHHFFDIARELLKKGADRNKSYLDYMWSNLSQWCEIRSDLSAVDKFIFKTSGRPLQAAIWKDDFDAVQFLLTAGADPNFSGPCEMSALATAMWRWNQAIINLLREYEALIHLRDLCFFVILTRKEKQELIQSLLRSDWVKDRIKHLFRRMNVLGRIIREIKLQQSGSRIDSLVGSMCHASVAQFQLLSEAW